MARQEEEREDLLAEATALVERVSLRIAGYEEEVVVGFRRDQSASIYFGGDPVYQFTSQGELRRAFVGNLLYKAREGRLVSLRRERSQEATTLVSRELDPAASQSFLQTMRANLERLHDALAKCNFSIVGQVPETMDLISRVCCWLDEFADRVEIAQSPRAC